jgi:hypothetical protein
MNLRQLKTNEIALLLHGLRAIYVHDEEAARQRMIERLETELAARGVALAGETV